MYYLCSKSKSVDQLCSDLICTLAKDMLSCYVASMSHVTSRLAFECPTKSDTNQAVQSQKMARGCTLRKKRNCTIYVAKT